MIGFTLRRTSCVTLASLTLAFVAAAGCASSSSTPSAHGQAEPSTISSLDFSPSPVVLRKGQDKSVHVIATMGDGSKKDVTDQVEWTSENPSTATVDAHGTVVGAGVGITTLKVGYKDATGSVKVTVAP